MDTLHIYGQYCWHDDANITGTRKALLKLALACLKTAITKRRSIADFMVKDGEGYDCIIEHCSGWCTDKPLPYTADYAQGRSDD